MSRFLKLTAMLAVFTCFSAVSACAEDGVIEKQLVISNHVFDPQNLEIPAGQTVRLKVINKDNTTAEFESDDLNREKIVPANGQIYVFVGPIDPGSYSYFDDFHRSTTTGKIVAK